MKNQSKILLAILPVLACFALLPGAQAQCVDGCDTNFGTFQGDGALINNGTGIGNSAFGWRALFFTSATNFNTAVGGGALALNNSSDNVAVGAAALVLNTSGSDNVAVGTDALVNNDGGSDNNAIGSFALFSNIGGFFNNAHGRDALTNSLGDENNAMGDDAMFNNTTGSFNTAVGDDALDGCTTGSSNVAVGDEAGNLVVAGSHIIAIGADVTGGGPFQDLDNTCYIGSIFNEPVSDPGTATAVFVDQFNVLGFNSSTRRVKHDIQSMDKASEPLFALKPVTFKYNSDKKERTQFGFIAEEVAKVNPDLVSHDKDGSAVSIRYEQINAMLLNEFLKEHKKVEEQQASISQLKGEMQTMVAQLKEQAAEIQKVSAQIQVNKPAPQVVINKP
jgi:trimeric autotransporter adhesin